MTQVWKSAEDQFKSWWQGKHSFCFQFHDTRAAMGNGQTKRVFTSAHPSDFLVTHHGDMFYAEVKSFGGVSFPFSNIKPSQWSAARQQIAAQGKYFFYLFSTDTRQWFKLEASFLLGIFATGRKSVKVSEILDFLWMPPQ